MRRIAIATALLLFAAPAGAQQEQSQEQPQEGPQQQVDAHTEFVKRVQIALHLQGFDPGPLNGVNAGATQAALAQFQLSRNLPASGNLDEQTLEALGVAQLIEENASTGAGMPLARP
ncbi:MAG TPA: peptidoglycan-binding domain-containing protein [Burkholderiales bacterium]|nr:peptidoglycan-binding domain-containing protein [Burkholderiales bacterium]